MRNTNKTELFLRVLGKDSMKVCVLLLNMYLFLLEEGVIFPVLGLKLDSNSLKSSRPKGSGHSLFQALR